MVVALLACVGRRLDERRSANISGLQTTGAGGLFLKLSIVVRSVRGETLSSDATRGLPVTDAGRNSSSFSSSSSSSSVSSDSGKELILTGDAVEVVDVVVVVVDAGVEVRMTRVGGAAGTGGRGGGNGFCGRGISFLSRRRVLGCRCDRLEGRADGVAVVVKSAS